jgi:hypothetical protein
MNDRLTNHGLTPWLLHAAASRLVEQSNPTAELTWGETDHTQAEGNYAPLKQSRCFALTSNDLLGGVLFVCVKLN